jgi:hypothetical protein
MDVRSRHSSLRAYHSVWQLRFDVWSSIAELTKQLADPTMPPDDRPASERELGELLGLVADPGAPVTKSPCCVDATHARC